MLLHTIITPKKNKFPNVSYSDFPNCTPKIYTVLFVFCTKIQSRFTFCIWFLRFQVLLNSETAAPAACPHKMDLCKRPAVLQNVPHSGFAYSLPRGVFQLLLPSFAKQFLICFPLAGTALRPFLIHLPCVSGVQDLTTLSLRDQLQAVKLQRC